MAALSLTKSSNLAPVSCSHEVSRGPTALSVLQILSFPKNASKIIEIIIKNITIRRSKNNW